MRATIVVVVCAALLHATPAAAVDDGGELVTCQHWITTHANAGASVDWTRLADFQNAFVLAWLGLRQDQQAALVKSITRACLGHATTSVLTIAAGMMGP